MELGTNIDLETFKKPILNAPSRSKAKVNCTDAPANKEAETLSVCSSTTFALASQDGLQEIKSAGAEKQKLASSVVDREPLAKYATMLKQLKYEEPPLSGPFDPRYGLEIVRNGSIVSRVEFSTEKSFCVIGRIPGCDLVGDHPTISRMHAILQFIENSDPSKLAAEGTCTKRGLYVYDLKSTHGTFMNKNRLFPNRYYRLHVGHVLKFGASTRLYVVLGPPEDEEEESEKTVTELVKEKNEKELIRKKATWKNGPDESDDEDEGVSWGMGEDAVEEAGFVNPFALEFQESKELSLDNPKRTLHTWFEREGHDLYYDVKEKASGHFVCTIKLPLDGPTGAPVVAEVDAKGRKKEIMQSCALKACEILDKYGVLRKSNQEGHKRKSKNWETNDYYSSDEDTFLDRTGSVEQKRKMRMKQAGKLEEKVETFDSLVEQYNSIQKEVAALQEKIQTAETRAAEEEAAVVDPLDAFMTDLKSGVVDMQNMKSKMKELGDEQGRLLKLINMVKPVGVSFPPNRNTTVRSESQNQAPAAKKMQILFGPRRGGAIRSKTSVVQIKPTKSVSSTKPPVKPEIIDVEMEEELHELPNPPASRSTNSSSTSKAEPRSTTGKEAEVNVDAASKENDSKVEISQKSLIDSGSDDESEKLRMKPKRKRHYPKKEVDYEYDANNPDYSIWVPPSDQEGDGKTKLNEKLGY